MKKNNKSKPLVIIQCYEDRQPTPLKKAETIISAKSEAVASVTTNGHTGSVVNGHSGGAVNGHNKSATNGHLNATSNGHTNALTNGFSKPMANSGQRHSPPKDVIGVTKSDVPPPPPPMPTTDGCHTGELKKLITNMQEKINTEIINGVGRNGKPVMRTPTPDYNNKSETPVRNSVQSNGKDEKAELESLESYKLKNPSLVQPRPPSNYFMKAPNGTATMKKHVRPVSVTIGEYGSGGGSRRPPSKLDFLNGDALDGSMTKDDMPLTNKLQSELALTLSRSNLRKKTDALVDSGR